MIGSRLELVPIRFSLEVFEGGVKVVVYIGELVSGFGHGRSRAGEIYLDTDRIDLR